MSLDRIATTNMAKKKREEKRMQWTCDQLAHAIQAANNGMGLRASAKAFSVPTTTLKRHLDGVNKYAIGSKKHRGRPSIFPIALEEELAQHILAMEERFFGMTRKDIMKLAFELAERNKLNHVFNKDKRQAGKDWLQFFLKRHPEISLRQLEATSMARATGFNKESVKKFFDILEDIIDQNNLDATAIYNMDETAISTVQKRCQKILGRKGKHQIGAISSGERGVNTTVVCSFSAAGHYVPPFILFKRKRMVPELGNGAPPGSVVTCNESGWMERETFLTWLHHFIACTKPSPAKKILLILDGHSSHTRNLAAINLARENSIIMLSLPPHTTHKLQPLDIGFFKPLQTYYNQTSESWLRNNSGRTVSAFQVSEIFCTAFMKAATMVTAVNSFRKCGIWPCNRDVFDDSEFLSVLEERSNNPNSAVFETVSSPISSSDNMHTPALPFTPCHSVSVSSNGLPRTLLSAPISLTVNAFLPAANSSTDLTTTQNFSTQMEMQPDIFSSSCNTLPTSTSFNSCLPQPIPSSCNSDMSQDSCCTIAAQTSMPATSCNALSTNIAAVSPTDSFKNKTIIPTNPDGRCFFRAVAISLEQSFQAARRDENGNAFDKTLFLQERLKADALRQQVIGYMLDHMDDFAEIEVAVNADMPRNQFCTLQDRIEAMSNYTACVGEMEIASTSEVLQKPIFIFHANNGHVIKYKKQKFASVTPINLLFRSFGNDTGHYDCLIPNQQQTPVKVKAPMVHVSVISPLPNLAQNKNKMRQKRKTEANILTGSPYKKLLSESLSKSTKTKAKRTPKIKAQKTKFTEEKQIDSTSWYCFMCSESTKEDMIQCKVCKQWAHEECAGTSGSVQEYMCEVCSV